MLEVEDRDGVRQTPADEPVDRSYELQDTAFVSWLGGGDPLPVDGPEGLASIELARQIRAAAR